MAEESSDLPAPTTEAIEGLPGALQPREPVLLGSVDENVRQPDELLDDGDDEKDGLSEAGPYPFGTTLVAALPSAFTHSTGSGVSSNSWAQQLAPPSSTQRRGGSGAYRRR